MEIKKINRSIIAMLSAIVLSLALVLVFSGVLQFVCVNATVVKVVNQIIKIVSILVGTFLCVRDCKGAIKGSSFGFIYAVITFFLFALVGGEKIAVDISFWLDMLFGTIAGCLCGIIAVNVRK